MYRVPCPVSRRETKIVCQVIQDRAVPGEEEARDE